VTANPASIEPPAPNAMLDPAKFAFTGDVAAVRTVVQTALKAMDAAENVDGDTDYLRTQAEENVLRDAAAKALEPLAESAADKALVARLQGDAAYARDEWAPAIAAYERGLALAPDDAVVLAVPPRAAASLLPGLSVGLEGLLGLG